MLNQGTPNSGALPLLNGAGDNVITNSCNVAESELRRNAGKIRCACGTTTFPFSVDDGTFLNALLTLRLGKGPYYN